MRLASLNGLAKVSEKLSNNRSIRSLYRGAKKRKLKVIILRGRKKRRFFVKVSDPEERQFLKIKGMCIFSIKTQTKIIKIRVPWDVLGVVDSI